MDMKEEYSNRFVYNKDEYNLLICYFRYMLGGDFMKKLAMMSEDMSASTEHIGYIFASSCDEEDMENGDYFEDGVLFFFGNDKYDEIIVDYNIFYNSLKLACDIYMELYPNKKDIISSKLKIIKERYNIQEL